MTARCRSLGNGCVPGVWEVPLVGREHGPVVLLEIPHAPQQRRDPRGGIPLGRRGLPGAWGTARLCVLIAEALLTGGNVGTCVLTTTKLKQKN